MQFGFYQANESTKFKQIPSLLCCGGVCRTDAGTSVGTDVCTGVGTTATSVGTGALMLVVILVGHVYWYL